MPEPITSLPEVNQELLTDEVQEVISYRPHWLVRKGNSLFLLIALLLLGLTFLIHYPDQIKSTARLTAENPPRLVAARSEGKLVRLFVANDQIVKRQMHLGYMESTGRYDEVLQLNDWVLGAIEKSRKDGLDWLAGQSLPRLTGLGELQASYQQFQNQLEITKQTLSNGYYQQKKAALNRDLSYLADLKRSAQHQQNLQQQDRLLQEKEYSAYELLEKEKVIAPLELNQYKSKLLGKDQTLEQLEAQMTNSEINSQSKQKEIMDLQKQVVDQQQLFRSRLLELKSDVEKWIQQYVLVAPEDGKVLFLSSLQENQLINNGDGLFFIEPDQSRYFVEIMTGQKGLGKIRVGQKVILRVDGYPSDEFGYLIGLVSHISGMPSRADSFLIKAELPHGLQTNYRKNLFFRNGLVAEAEIITDNRRLFDRLAGQLKEVWKR